MRSVLLLACLLAGCARDAMPGVPEQQEGVVTVSWPDPAPHRIDLLFVIDDSSAMEPFAAPLADEIRFGALELGGIGEDIDLHVAVVTSDVGDEQDLPYTPVPGQCAGWGDGAALRRSELVDGAYIAYRSVRGEVRTNVTGSVADALGELAAVGTEGCAHPRPLEAMRVALDHDAGFLRDNADLSVVIVGGRDDESPGSLADYAAFLRRVDRDPAVVVAGGKPLRSICGEPSTDRLYALTQLFPNRGSFASICAIGDGYVSQDALWYHLPRFGSPIGDPCFEALLADIDPATPGVQPECTVSDHIVRGTADEEERLMAACGTGALPCWRIVEDNLCTGFQHLRVEVDRGGEDPPDNDVVEAQCVSL